MILVLVGIVVCQAGLFLDLVVLVVAGKDDDRRMMTEPSDVGGCLGRDGLQYLRIAGIVATAEHEILPYEDPKLVTCGV